jgi:NAD-specific glutamate dehydrogenase
MNHSDTATDVSSLPPNQLKALNALLKNTTIEAAAKECSLGSATVKRYLADERFSRLYREQRMIILSQTVAGLTQLGSRAIEKIEAGMDSDDENTALRAASRVLDYLVKLVELERKIRDQDEIEERLRRLEEASLANGHNGWSYRQ